MNDKASKVRKLRPISAGIHQELRARIIRMEILPHAILQKDELSNEFGVSRTPVNDALVRLRDEGLIRIASQHGSFVEPIRQSTITECMFASLTIEPRAVGLAASTVNDQLISSLNDNLDAQADAIRARDEVRLADLDQSFHDLFLTHCGFERIAQYLRGINGHLMRARHLSPREPSRSNASMTEHTRIVNAVKHGNAGWAESEMKSHLSAAFVVLTQIMEANSDRIERSEAEQELGLIRLSAVAK